MPEGARATDIGEAEAAVVVVCSALGSPRTPAGVGRAVHRVCAAVQPGTGGWLTKALVDLDIRYSATDKWSSASLRNAIRAAMTNGWLVVENGRFSCTEEASQQIGTLPGLTESEDTALAAVGSSVLHGVP